jgi:ribonuclease HI
MLPTELDFRLARIGCLDLGINLNPMTNEVTYYCGYLRKVRADNTECLLDRCPKVIGKVIMEEVKPFNPTKYVGFFDGSATPNPGLMKIGGYIKDDKGDVVEQYSIALGHGTNNQAEYKSLRHLVNVLTQYHPESVEIYGDSLLVVNQINGKYKVSDPELKKIHSNIMQLLALIPHWKIIHVPREKNQKADNLT